jgi:hypothetical protein
MMTSRQKVIKLLFKWITGKIALYIVTGTVILFINPADKAVCLANYTPSSGCT